MSDSAVRSRRRNAAKQVTALTLQNMGDRVVDAKTVLSWLLTALGAPAAFAGLLVPIREAGSMLPQTVLMPFVQRLRVRRWVWVVGALTQAICVAAMALVAATLDGLAAGLGILGALALFAVGRSASSIATKDVLGRTIPKGRRGRVTGFATVASGAAAITLGIAMRAIGGEHTPAATFAWLLVGAAATWLLAAAVFATVREDPGDHEDVPFSQATSTVVRLLREDAPFRRFMLARTLLLVSALSPPYVVVLATRIGGSGLSGLGPFVISSGIAALIGGGVWGRAADHSSRRVMMAAAGGSSAVVFGFLLALRVDGLRELTLLYPAAYLMLALAHTGSRIGRKTYVVDLAEGNTRTEYVAVSNTAMGVLLLVAGAISAGVAAFGVEAALLLLALLGVAGVVASRSLPEVTSDQSG